jgi:hypothetical protein
MPVEVVQAWGLSPPAAACRGCLEQALLTFQQQQQQQQQQALLLLLLLLLLGRQVHC